MLPSWFIDYPIPFFFNVCCNIVKKIFKDDQYCAVKYYFKEYPVEYVDQFSKLGTVSWLCNTWVHFRIKTYGTSSVSLNSESNSVCDVESASGIWKVFWRRGDCGYECLGDWWLLLRICWSIVLSQGSKRCGVILHLSTLLFF